MNQMSKPPKHGEPWLSDEKAVLLRRGIRLNTILLSAVMGVGCGFAIFLFTHLSILLTGDRAGMYLNLLGVFFPGYSATPGGAWIGLVWGFVFGSISGGFIYYFYARAVGTQLSETISPDSIPDHLLEQPTLRIAGHEFGLTLGCLMALQLFLATMWLIVRGTAHKSVHAALLMHYFPGYSVSLEGGLLGAAYMLVVTYAFSRLLAGLYNFIVSKRSRKEAR